MAFLLARAPYHYNDATIGLFGLVGAVGALSASLAGRLADKGHANLSSALGFGLMLLSWVPLALGVSSLIALLIGIIVLDLAIQGVHISNQSIIYRHRPEARSRITSAYMTANFIGAAIGSLLSAAAFERMGWNGVVVVGMVLSLAGCLYVGVLQWRSRRVTRT